MISLSLEAERNILCAMKAVLYLFRIMFALIQFTDKPMSWEASITQILRRLKHWYVQGG
jgi:hypothetical protein